MSCQQICSNYVMLSGCGPKSQRNVSCTLLNVCQKALWHFGRQYEVQLDTSILLVFEGFHFFKECATDRLERKNGKVNANNNKKQFSDIK